MTRSIGSVCRPEMWLLSTLLCCLVVLGASSVQANDFRVETRVFGEEGDEPTDRTTTLFHQGAVYDFPAAGSEITIFAPKDARVVLLDTKRRVRTELTVDQLFDFSGRLRDWAAKQDDGLLKFTVDPKFEHQDDAAGGRMSLASRWMSYELQTRSATTKQMATQYLQFCDVCAHLNTLLNPGSLPPFGRLEVNRRLAEGANLPTEIQLTIPAVRMFGDREVKLATRHEYVETLSDADLASVEKAGRHNATFRAVSLAEFRGVSSDAAKR